TNITGNITLDFYFIPKINEVEEYMPWLYNGRYGKDNPFKSIGGVGNNSNSNLSVVAPKKYDFNMMVKPTSSDLPTVILGKSEDSNRSTYVYGDNDGIEEVKIEFVEKSGKYFFKYKTLNNIYPKSNNIGQEFSPKGDSINLIIYSTKRNSEEDTSGMDLKISNGTSKKVFVKILSDDKSRPRVNVITEKGEIKQER
ncbi:MAG: type IV pilus assembly protein PilO, partial [Clostridium sp.]